DLLLAGSTQVRNAADFVGRIREFSALPELKTAMSRTDISTEAKVHIVKAVGYMAHPRGNEILEIAMRDAAAPVRAAAAVAWRDILGQVSAAPLLGLLADADAQVRAEAATVLGAYGERD